MTAERGRHLPARVPLSLDRVVEWARTRVPLYRDLYAGCPSVTDWRGFCRLPVLTPERLRGTPLIDQLDDPRDAFRTFTPYMLHSVVAAATHVADRDDTDAAFDECRDAFALLGVGAGANVAVVTDPERRYTAAEMAERLGYFDVRAHVVVRIDEAVLDTQLAALAPDRVVVMGRPLADDAQREVTIRHPRARCADLYMAPEAGIVGVRPAGESSYVVLKRHYIVETQPDGHLLLTSLRRYHQPLIRYALPEGGHIAGGRLWLEEVAP